MMIIGSLALVLTTGENPGHCMVSQTFTAIVEAKDAKEVMNVFFSPLKYFFILFAPSRLPEMVSSFMEADFCTRAIKATCEL